MQKLAASGNRRYIYDGDQLFLEASDSYVEAEYAYYPGVDQPHSVRLGGDNAQMYYYATEEPGNVVGLIDGQNRLVNHYVYEPWVRMYTARESVSNSLYMAAREFDGETGLYYMRNRYYYAALGRFLSEDPIGIAGGINPYAYAGDNPVNVTDPYGLAPCNNGATMIEACPTPE